jgi:hypothetical protein
MARGLRAKALGVNGSIGFDSRHATTAKRRKLRRIIMDNYKAIEQKLANLEPFRGNSMTAFWNDNKGGLDVYSYNTCIGQALVINGQIVIDYFNRNKYSTTTSRHQNLIRRAWGVK